MLKNLYIDDEHANIQLQNTINKMDSIELKKKPQQIKNPQERNGIKVFQEILHMQNLH